MIDTSYAASLYGVSASYKTTNASLNISGSYLEIMGGVNGSHASSPDGVDLSEKALELANRIKELDVFKVIFPNNDARQKTKSLGEVENDFLSDFNSFAGLWGQMSSMLGLDASSAFTMGLDGQGGVTVEGSDESTAGKVQNAFNASSTMVSRFAVMAARAALADAGHTLDGFKDSYAQDPYAAISDNIDALKDRLLGFRTVAGGGSMQYGFVRDVNLSIEYSSTTASYAYANAAEEAGTEETASV